LDFTNITTTNTTNPNNTQDGERSPTRGPCKCGYKHWYNGKEYDFVFRWPTSSGVQHLAVNANDNIYAVAEEFVLKYEMTNYSMNNQHIINNITDRVTRHISQFTTLNVDNKTVTSANHFDFDDTIPIFTDQDIEDMKKRDELHKREKEKVNQEIEKKKKDKDDIKARMENDRKEVDAQRKINSPDVKKPNVPNGYVSVVGEDGNVKIVPKSQARNPTGGPSFGSLRDLKENKKSASPSPDHSDSTSDDDEDADIWEKYGGYPPKDKWTKSMLVWSIRNNGQEETEETMLRSGFSKSEVAKYISAVVKNQALRNQSSATHVRHSPTQNTRHVDSFESPGKAFAGIGHKLSDNSGPAFVAIAASNENYQIEVDASLPQTSIRVRLFDGKQITVNVNHSTTVDQLIQHIRSASNLSLKTQFTLKNMGDFPPRVLTQPSLTIKDANLVNGNVVQALVSK